MYCRFFCSKCDRCHFKDECTNRNDQKSIKVIVSFCLRTCDDNVEYDRYRYTYMYIYIYISVYKKRRIVMSEKRGKKKQMSIIYKGAYILLHSPSSYGCSYIYVYVYLLDHLSLSCIYLSMIIVLCIDIIVHDTG